MAILMDLRVESKDWEAIPELEALCQRALDAGCAGQAPSENSAEDSHVDVLLADDATLEALNTQWRGKPKPTDVLSFPAEACPGNFLGDIAIAHGVAARDAKTSGKTLTSHLSHLLIHGLLHLMGHDHIEDEDALIMENLERSALASIGIDDPYSRITRN